MIKSLLISLLFFAQIPFPGPGRAPVSVPSGPYSDDFNRADSATLGSNWTDISAGIGIAGNQAVGVSGNQASYWSANAFSDDQYSEITVPSSFAPYIGPNVRASGSDFYEAVANNSTIYIRKYSGGSYPTLCASPYSTSISSGNTLRLEATTVSGDVVLKIFVNGVQVGSDCNLTGSDRIFSGSAGISIISTGPIESWAGGDLP